MKELIQKLRSETGAGIVDAKNALVETNSDYEKAKEILVAKGFKNAAGKADREVNEGIVFSYIRPNSKLGSFIELNCETDFVAKNEIFLQLANDIALHITTSDVEYVSELLQESFIKDESITIQTLIQNAIAKLGENIVLKRFVKFQVGN